jgi:D-glycero-beta-D-manno-heptose-7-phosphate kinase
MSAQIISKFSGLKIVVLGDFMLDQFIWGHVDRISPEAPVPIVSVLGESASLGGAGNVVQNLRSMGASVIPIGVVGRDEAGNEILDLLQAQNVRSEGMLLTDRMTTVKTRILAHHQQVVRVDREEKHLIPETLQSELSRLFLEALENADGAIISDYSKGCISPNLLEEILPEAKRRNKKICLDPKTRYFSSYTPVTILTPNQAEASVVLGYPIVSDEDLREAGRRILKMIDCEALLITRGEKGMALFHGGEVTTTSARAREVFDVTGAGDTVISILCLSLAAGADFQNAVELTNAAAGFVVGKIGTATVTPDELLAAL